MGIGNLPRSMGNPYTENGSPSTYTWSAIFDALTRLGPEGHLEPGLAVAWSPVAENRWRFELRRGVVFTNGEPFDARAVVGVVEWLGTPEGRRTVIGNELRSLVGAVAVDSHTVELISDGPDAILPQRLSAVLIVPPDAWTRLGPDGFALQPHGTGPFRVVEWSDRERTVRLVANPDSWRPPRLPGLTLKGLPDKAVRVQALRSGEVDLTLIDIEDVDFLQARGFRVHHSPSMQVMALAFNVERDPPSPVADQRVRQAINHAVDKHAIAEILLQGMVRPSGQPASRVTTGYNPDVDPYRYDPERARQLLAEAGWPEGFDLTIHVAEGGVPGAAQIYQVIVQYLGRVGIRARLQVRPFPAWLRDYLAGSISADMFGLPWNAAPYNDVMRPVEYYSCAKRNPFFCDPALMPLIERTGREIDPERRDALLKELAARLHDLAPSLFLVEQMDLFAHHDGVDDLIIANRVPLYERLSLTPPRP
jgi:peptide/nickel transport system substrate-binding protein